MLTCTARSLRKTLESMAYTDSLTGLPNRAYFYDRLERACQDVSKNYSRFLLLVLDLDRFNTEGYLLHEQGKLIKAEPYYRSIMMSAAK